MILIRDLTLVVCIMTALLPFVVAAPLRGSRRSLLITPPIRQLMENNVTASPTESPESTFSTNDPTDQPIEINQPDEQIPNKRKQSASDTLALMASLFFAVTIIVIFICSVRSETRKASTSPRPTESNEEDKDKDKKSLETKATEETLEREVEEAHASIPSTSSKALVKKSRIGESLGGGDNREVIHAPPSRRVTTSSAVMTTRKVGHDKISPNDPKRAYSFLPKEPLRLRSANVPRSSGRMGKTLKVQSKTSSLSNRTSTAVGKEQTQELSRITSKDSPNKYDLKWIQNPEGLNKPRSKSEDFFSSDSSAASSTLEDILDPIKSSPTAGNHAIEVFVDDNSSTTESEPGTNSWYKEDDSLRGDSVMSAAYSESDGVPSTLLAGQDGLSLISREYDSEYGENEDVLPGSPWSPASDTCISDAPSDEQSENCIPNFPFPEDELDYDRLQPKNPIDTSNRMEANDSFDIDPEFQEDVVQERGRINFIARKKREKRTMEI